MIGDNLREIWWDDGVFFRVMRGLMLLEIRNPDITIALGLISDDEAKVTQPLEQFFHIE